MVIGVSVKLHCPVVVPYGAYVQVEGQGERNTIDDLLHVGDQTTDRVKYYFVDHLHTSQLTTDCIY